MFLKNLTIKGFKSFADSTGTLSIVFDVPPELRKSRAERHGVVSHNYISYNRQDVAASQALLERVRRVLFFDLQEDGGAKDALARNFTRRTHHLIGCPVGRYRERHPIMGSHLHEKLPARQGRIGA